MRDPVITEAIGHLRRRQQYLRDIGDHAQADAGDSYIRALEEAYPTRLPRMVPMIERRKR